MDLILIIAYLSSVFYYVFNYINYRKKFKSFSLYEKSLYKEYYVYCMYKKSFVYQLWLGIVISVTILALALLISKIPFLIIK